MDSNSSILSKLFTQMWYMNSNSEGSASDDEIMGQALSSPIYPKCVEAYCKYNTNSLGLRTTMYKRGFEVHHAYNYSVLSLSVL